MLTHCTHARTPLYTQPCIVKTVGELISYEYVRLWLIHSGGFRLNKSSMLSKTSEFLYFLPPLFSYFFPLVLLGPQKQEAQVNLRGHYFGCSLCLECSFSGFTHGSLPFFRPILLKCHPTSPNLAWSTCVNSIPCPSPALPNHPILSSYSLPSSL